jgi:hypothetical protein
MFSQPQSTGPTFSNTKTNIQSKQGDPQTQKGIFNVNQSNNSGNNQSGLNKQMIEEKKDYIKIQREGSVNVGQNQNTSANAGTSNVNATTIHQDRTNNQGNRLPNSNDMQNYSEFIRRQNLKFQKLCELYRNDPEKFKREIGPEEFTKFENVLKNKNLNLNRNDKPVGINNSFNK